MYRETLVRVPSCVDPINGGAAVETKKPGIFLIGPQTSSALDSCCEFSASQTYPPPSPVLSLAWKNASNSRQVASTVSPCRCPTSWSSYLLSQFSSTEEERRKGKWTWNLSLSRQADQTTRIGFQNRRARWNWRRKRIVAEGNNIGRVSIQGGGARGVDETVEIGEERGEGSAGCVRRALLVNLARGVCECGGAVLKRETWATSGYIDWERGGN